MDRTIVKDIFKKGSVSVHSDETLSKCLTLFKKELPPVLVVFGPNAEYKGVLSRRWITRSRLDPTKTKVKSLMRSAPMLSISDSLSKTARLMIESEIRQLPVFERGKLLGFVTDEDIIHSMVIGEWGSAIVEDIMTEQPFTLEAEDSVGAALSLFREHGISHAPVVKEAKLVGILSIQDIIDHIFKPRQRLTRGDKVGEKLPVLSISVKGIMTKPVITALPNSKLREAEQKMHKFDISSLIIVQKGRPIGIVTKRDFLEPIAQAERVESGLAVQFSLKDVTLDEAQRGRIIKDFDSFSRKYGKSLENGTLFAYMKTHGTNYRGEQLIHCRLQLRTVKGSFFGSGEGYGAEQTFKMAVDGLERQILRDKETRYERELVKDYFNRLQFPMTEL